MAGPFFLVVLCWIAFGAVFLIRRKGGQTQERSRDRASLAGMGVQGVGFFLVWVNPHPFGQPPSFGDGSALTVAITASLLAVASVGLALWAAATLGRQWSFTARLVEGHELIVRGPYRFVRHPIYVAMFGMLWATGLLLATPVRLVAASFAYAVGTAVRVRSEERLLRSEFGSDWDRYAREVPAVIPGWRRKRDP